MHDACMITFITADFIIHKYCISSDQTQGENFYSNCLTVYTRPLC